jgi:hypothetical protein
LIKLGDAFDSSRFGDEGGPQDTDWIAGLCNFDRVINVWYYS